MIPLEDARAHVLGRCPPLPAEMVGVDEALGCILAEPVTAAEAVPPFANTAMDGFAVRAADTVEAADDRPVRLGVVGTLAAGAAHEGEIGPGEALRIMTGAPMPAGADAVVMVERTIPVDGGSAVDVVVAVEPGTHVRGVGGDVPAGAEILPAATVLGPAHLGVLASIGRTQVLVVRRPRVGVLSTGDELVDDGRSLRPGQIRESNRPMLLALVDRAGWHAVDLGLVADDEVVLANALTDGAKNCDALLTSGGVSMGDYDVVKVVLDRLADMAWMQIAIKPSKPFAFGLIGSTPVFGLPGNPVSAMVSFEVLARPALRQMAGHARLDRPRVAAIADDGLGRRPDGKLHLMRVEVNGSAADGRFHARSVGGQASHQLAATSGANGLAVVPDGDGITPGDPVQVLLLDAESALTPDGLP